MKRLIAFVGALLCLAAPAWADQIVLTTGTSWTVPLNWSNANTVEAIGGGAVGGGAYAKKLNATLVPGAVITIQIGQGAVQGANATDTCFNGCGFLKAAGALTTNGGSAAASVGDVTFSGGGASIGVGRAAGGGAAGPHGNGQNAASVAVGGAGDAGFGGAGGVMGGDAADGSEIAPGVGSGGGGGGNVSCGCAGGLYGGGSTNQTGIFGRNGVIVITYTPQRRVSQGAF